MIPQLSYFLPRSLLRLAANVRLTVILHSVWSGARLPSHHFCGTNWGGERGQWPHRQTIIELRGLRWSLSLDRPAYWPSRSIRSNVVLYLPARWRPGIRWSGGRREAAGQGEAQAGLSVREVVSSPVVPVLSFLTGLQGRLDLRCVPVPARVQRPLVMG